MKRGSVYWVNLDPASSPEMGKTRPALVISNSDQNLILGSVVVVPLSLKPREIWPLRVKLEIKTKKPHESFAIVPAMRQVSKGRLGELVGFISNADLERITEALQNYLS